MQELLNAPLRAWIVLAAMLAMEAPAAAASLCAETSANLNPMRSSQLSGSARHQWAKLACDRINSVYSSCGSRFNYDGQTFDFRLRSSRQAVACDDGRSLEFHDRVDAMDIASTFMFPYKSGAVPLPECRRNYDPGRLRSEELLKSVYGADESSVRANLTKVSFLGQTVRFQKKLGAAAALSRVSEELLREARSDASLARFLEPWTTPVKPIDLRFFMFSWRVVKGTSRLSTHSFGTAIDLNTNVGPQYWLWDEQATNPSKAAQGENAYRGDYFVPRGAPQFHAKVVEIFERNGFIWGGKWNHYDTMHFEYRPEFFTGYEVDCSTLSASLDVPIWLSSAPMGAFEDDADFGIANAHVCDH